MLNECEQFVSLKKKRKKHVLITGSEYIHEGVLGLVYNSFNPINLAGKYVNKSFRNYFSTMLRETLWCG